MMERYFWYVVSFGCGVIATLFNFIFFQCKHKFYPLEMVEKRKQKIWSDDVIQRLYISRCEHCCKLKIQTVK